MSLTEELLAGKRRDGCCSFPPSLPACPSQCIPPPLLLLPPFFLTFHSQAIETTPSLEEDSESYYHLLMTRVDEALLLPPEGGKGREGGRGGMGEVTGMYVSTYMRKRNTEIHTKGKILNYPSCLSTQPTRPPSLPLLPLLTYLHIHTPDILLHAFTNKQMGKKRASGRTTRLGESQRWSCETCLGQATVRKEGRKGGREGGWERAFRNLEIHLSSFILLFKWSTGEHQGKCELLYSLLLPPLWRLSPADPHPPLLPSLPPPLPPSRRQAPG